MTEKVDVKQAKLIRKLARARCRIRGFAKDGPCKGCVDDVTRTLTALHEAGLEIRERPKQGAVYGGSAGGSMKASAGKVDR